MLNINNTLDGFLKDVEIKGNTIQDIEQKGDLADIRSVGDKVEGQELYKIDILATNGLDVIDTSYQEDKLTILSPVQLEKVGDVADRIICKDGVWGVEKWIGVYNFEDISSFGVRNTSDSMSTFEFTMPIAVREGGDTLCICSSILGNTYNNIFNNTNVEGIGVKAYNTTNYCRLNILNNRLSSFDKVGFDKFINENNTKLYFVLDKATFIPLPHSQQIKLRTFASKTNISFLTEIKGTIKAQVPKSLGATVNSHTEQIGNLSKELDRVKKLEESTVSTVTTESNFTTVEETSNGYFEDVKLEGKTLVNLCESGTYNIGAKHTILPIKPIDFKFKLSFNIIESTIQTSSLGIFAKIVYEDSSISDDYVALSNKGASVGLDYVIFNPKAKVKQIELEKHLSVISGDVKITNLLLMNYEDVENVDISYFEGLMSVGEDVEEASVESVDGNGNLIDETKITLNTMVNTHGNLFTNEQSNLSDYIKIKNGDVFTVPSGIGSGSIGVALYNKNKNYIKSIPLRTPVDTPCTFTVDNDGYMRVALWTTQPMMLFKGDKLKEYQPYQSNKKPLLYYNNETQTWEKPVLRQWDSIEKHGDGKYYYHKRSGEVVLNGSELDWKLHTGDGNRTTVGMEITILPKYNEQNADVIDIICDKLLCISANDSYGTDLVGIASRLNLIRLRLDPTIVGGTDLTSMKAWLQANPTTVVYQLAEEEVYECTNIDLITYENETNYISNTGAISPKSTLKVHSNISNVVKILQEKVSLLESNVKASQEVQDMMILESDLRILDMELALMEHMPIKLNLANEGMLRSATYFNFIKNHIVNETYEKEYLENVMNKYLATNRLTQEEYNELYKMLHPQNYDIELPIEE